MANNGAALAKAEPRSAAISPQTLPDLFRLAGALMQARGMIPDRIQSEGELVATVLAGQELGLGPMASLRGIHVVKGKVGLNYDLMVGLLRRAGYGVEWVESTEVTATVRLTAPTGKSHTETFDKADAQRAQLWGSGMGWKKYPKAMLKARAVSAAARAFAGDVLHGCYTEDEIREIRGNGAHDGAHSPREDFDYTAADEQAAKRKEAEDWAAFVVDDIESIDTAKRLETWIAHNGKQVNGLNNTYQQNAYGKLWRRLMKAADRVGVSNDDLRAMLREADGEIVDADTGEVSDWRDEPMGFGKHKSTPLRDVPSGYLAWLGDKAQTELDNGTARNADRARETVERCTAELRAREKEATSEMEAALDVSDGDPWEMASTSEAEGRRRESVV